MLEQAQGEEARLCLTPQIFSEVHAIATNPRRVSQPRTPQDALSALNRILELPGIVLLPIPLDILDRMTFSLQKYPVKGNGIFDIQLVATMLGNGVDKIYTFNREHFQRFAEIKVVSSNLTPVENLDDGAVEKPWKSTRMLLGIWNICVFAI